MNRSFSATFGGLLLAIGLSACAAPAAQPQPVATEPGPAPASSERACDATSLSWTIGQVADDALVERARVEAGAKTVRVIRPGVMVTNDYSAQRLNLRVDVERKVLAYNCG